MDHHGAFCHALREAQLSFHSPGDPGSTLARGEWWHLEEKLRKAGAGEEDNG